MNLDSVFADMFFAGLETVGAAEDLWVESEGELRECRGRVNPPGERLDEGADMSFEVCMGDAVIPAEAAPRLKRGDCVMRRGPGEDDLKYVVEEILARTDGFVHCRIKHASARDLYAGGDRMRRG